MLPVVNVSYNCFAIDDRERISVIANDRLFVAVEKDCRTNNNNLMLCPLNPFILDNSSSEDVLYQSVSVPRVPATLQGPFMTASNVAIKLRACISTSGIY